MRSLRNERIAPTLLPALLGRAVRSRAAVKQPAEPSQAGVVVDHHMDVLEAVCAFNAAPVVPARNYLALPVSDRAVAGTPEGEPPQLLDIDVHELAWATTLGLRQPRIKPYPHEPMGRHVS
jgi:hypothetical protein